MKFVIYITFFLIIFAIILLLWQNFMKKRERISRISTEILLKNISHSFDEMYFFSAAVRRIVMFLMLDDTKEAKNALFFLSHGKKFDVLRDYLIAHKKAYLAGVFCAFSNLDLAEEILLEQKYKPEAMLQLAYINLLKNQKDEAKSLLNNVDENKLPPAERGIYRYCMAKIALEIGDLYNASNDANVAIRFFHKTRSFYEEAKTYILLGEVYRVSAVSDMAYFMYDEAKKIAEKQHNYALKADALGCMGMLFTMQERFDAAEDAFKESLEINKKIIRDKACACIYNQLALLKLLDEKYEEARGYISQALRYSFENINAFSFEIMAKVCYAEKQYDQAIKNADIAQKKYWKCQNLTAFFEALYLETSVLFDMQDYDKAEKNIRHLLSVANENESAFHLANAYSMLGSIYMKKENYTRAKPFFEEAIRHELKNNRIEGMISDYMNLGIIARNSGDEEGALINFREAKRYANEVQNYDLENMVEEYISNQES